MYVLCAYETWIQMWKFKTHAGGTAQQVSKAYEEQSGYAVAPYFPLDQLDMGR